MPREAECLAFVAGPGTQAFRSVAQNRASVRASQLMTGLCRELENAGADDHALSVFLLRVLHRL
jgi:hypothetical protein